MITHHRKTVLAFAGMKKYVHKGRQWHAECFRCKVCHRLIGTNSFIRQGQDVTCVPCYERQFGQQCTKCKGFSNRVLTYFALGLIFFIAFNGNATIFQIKDAQSYLGLPLSFSSSVPSCFSLIAYRLFQLSYIIHHNTL